MKANTGRKPPTPPRNHCIFPIRMNLLAQTSAATSGDFAVGWGTLALLNAGIAQGKNRSGLNWFLLSIVLGPVASLILVAFMNKLPPGP